MARKTSVRRLSGITTLAILSVFTSGISASAFTDNSNHPVHISINPELWGTHSLSIRSIENGLMSGTTECHQMSEAFVSAVITDERALGANTATVDMPYDDASGYAECQPTDPRAYESVWVDAIHSAGLRVWFRQAWNTWDAYYGEPKLSYTTSPRIPYETAGGAADVLAGRDRNSYLAKTYQFILGHASYFAPGDIFTPASEADGAGIGPNPGCATALCEFPSIPAFNGFLRDSITVDRAAFKQIGVDVFVGLFGTSCEYLDRLEPATVAAMGVVSTDCYVPTATRLQHDLDTLHQTYGVPIVLSEWGDIWDGAREPETEASVARMLELVVKSPFIAGMGYWQGIGGPGGEGLIGYPTLQITPAGYSLQRWYTVAADSCDDPGDPLTAWASASASGGGSGSPAWCREHR